MSNTHIKLFVTKNYKFRAVIDEYNTLSERNVTYEVTIGGEQWRKGKGRKHEKRILEMMNTIRCSLADQVHRAKEWSD